MKKRLLLCCTALALTLGLQAQERRPRRGVEDVNKVTDLTLDSLNKANTARPVPGSSRKGDNPVLFLIGNSTMRTGTLGNGNNGQWGWGYFAGEYFDQDRITVENHALGGTSSRTFYNRLWPDVLKGIRKGDWVIIELGHNDNGPYDEGRARASIPGTGKDSLCVTIKETGVKETVYTYGEYLRRFINDVRAVGAHPVLMSLTPRNSWESEGVLTRKSKNFTPWIKEVCAEEHVPFVNLEEITARKYEQFGPTKVNYMFYLDRIHTSEFGARINARSAAEGIAACPELELKQYLKPLVTPVCEGLHRQKGKPVVFFTGDSTVKNNDSSDDGMWGLGSVAACAFDTTRVTLYNNAKAGRSTRTFLEEGRWDEVYNSIQPGDYVFIQFGHNDMGTIDTKRERAVINGTADSSHVYRMASDRRYKVVYTFGWYLRKFVQDVREKGGIPVLVSFTPRNEWKNGKIERRNNSAAGWTRQVAEETGCLFVDLHNLTADYLDKKGEKKAAAYYNHDHTHLSKKGAILNATLLAKGLKKAGVDLMK
ncbi:MAG: rhamnogalacturonan acetylesterase [Bacteroidaceae bacterium]|nr:rhamnogalacturonan acetylesterase [Bacteroidaceae bacterium]